MMLAKEQQSLQDISFNMTGQKAANFVLRKAFEKSIANMETIRSKERAQVHAKVQEWLQEDDIAHLHQLKPVNVSGAVNGPNMSQWNHLIISEEDFKALEGDPSKLSPFF